MSVHDRFHELFTFLLSSHRDTVTRRGYLRSQACQFVVLAVMLCLIFLFLEPAKLLAEESKVTQNDKILKVATFGGGCFWCTEAVFQRLKGVEKVVSGYSGGHVVNPTYEQVCGKKTGHVEVIQITYDPSEVTFEKLLIVFFKTHDPTTKNRQGADSGPQYRSVVFYQDEEQKKVSEEVLKKLDDKIFKGKIVTDIDPLINFYPAEDYHQNYFNDNPGNSYCQGVVASKVRKFIELFGDDAK